MRQVDLEDNSEVPALEMVQNRKTKSKTKRCAAFFCRNRFKLCEQCIYNRTWVIES